MTGFFQIILFVFFTLSFSFPSEAIDSNITIRIGDAKLKKSLVAFPKPIRLGSPTSVARQESVGVELFSTITNDLTVASYFQFLSEAAFLEKPEAAALRPHPVEKDGFRFEPWASIGAEFLIRVGYSIINKDLEVEAYFYHVPTQKLTLGKRYKSTFDNVRKVAHTFSNDVVSALTHHEGMFLSKVVVSSDRNVAPSKEIYLIDWDGTNPTKISNHRSISISPAWSWDNSTIAYTSYVSKRGYSGRNADMFLYNVSSGKRTLLSYRRGVNSGAAFLPDGESLFMTHSHGSNSDIYRISTRGKVIQRVTQGPLGALNVEPAVCPQKNLLAFSSDRSGRPMIYRSSIDGSNVKRLTIAGVFNSTPSWSPDCSKIAFAGQDDNNFDVFVMEADGSNMQRITRARAINGRWSNNEDPVFSPNGLFLMYTSNRSGKNQIYISTVDGKEERRITQDQFNYYRPKWSKNFE